jgi:hypothetical protein
MRAFRVLPAILLHVNASITKTINLSNIIYPSFEGALRHLDKMLSENGLDVKAKSDDRLLVFGSFPTGETARRAPFRVW